MKKEVLEALKGAIKKWQRNVKLAKEGKSLKLDPDSCPLCDLFLNLNCSGCPISKDTGYEECVNTPYIFVCNRVDRGTREEVVEECKEEVGFLRSLLPKKRKSPSRK